MLAPSLRAARRTHAAPALPSMSVQLRRTTAGTLPSWADLPTANVFILPGNPGLCGEVGACLASFWPAQVPGRGLRVACCVAKGTPTPQPTPNPNP